MEMKYIDKVMTAEKTRNTRMKTCPSATLCTKNPNYTPRPL
jgi:hypothetical protein